MNAEFQKVVDFHQHLCLDIAIGYRASKILIREMAGQLSNMKEVIALVGNETCALDAIQEVTGCTFGKRNLLLTGLGKPVYILQNTKSGKAVRAYCTYWDTFDHTELRTLRTAVKRGDANHEEKEALQKLTKKTIDHILSAEESTLFSVRHTVLSAPPKSGKYKALACDKCGEHTNIALLSDRDGKKLCKECDLQTET